MKLSRLMPVFAFVLAIGVAGCGTANQTPSVIHAGATKMLSISADLKKAIAAGDEAAVKATGPKLEDTWSSFEDSVKQKYPDLYKQVEDYLDPATAASQASPLDKQTLALLNDKLAHALNQLAAKEK